MVVSLEDILSIDSSLSTKKIYVRKFFNSVQAWRDDGGRIPNSLLDSSKSPSSAIHIVDTASTTTPIKVIAVLHSILSAYVNVLSSSWTQ
jgi:hypothetical protein